MARGPGTVLWRDIKWDAAQSFKATGGGRQAVKILLEGNARRVSPLAVHLVGHSAGSILIGHRLEARTTMNPLHMLVKSCALMAPACTVDFFRQFYAPKFGNLASTNGIAKLWQYNLNDQR